jgi:hypothetical protein
VLAGEGTGSPGGGVLAEIEGLGLGVLEVCQLTRTANNQDQVTPANRDGG